MRYQPGKRPSGFWGKLSESEGQWHPLQDHCLDVAACAKVLLSNTILGKRLAKLAGLDSLSPSQIIQLVILIALHDIGKFGRFFQNKAETNSRKSGHVEEAWALLSYGLASPALEKLGLLSWGDCVVPLLYASIGHHGSPVRAGSGTAPTPNLGGELIEENWREGPDLAPLKALEEFCEQLSLLLPENFTPEPLPTNPEFVHAFAGLVTLADWLGSSRAYFPYRTEGDDRPRFEVAEELATEAFRAMGLLGDARAAFDGPPGFDRVLPFPPRGAQTLLSELPPEHRLTEGSLLFFEAATGAGKTEAAFWHFLRLYEAGQVGGLYFALPTRTAAVEIYERAVDIIARAFPDDALRPPVTLAVPGYLGTDGQEGTRLAPFEVLWPDSEHERFRHRSWAAEHPKRYLAGAISIGTIDQVLLSGVRNRHAHLRSTALLRSLLVIDEVHASDAYMTRLLEPVLAHHIRAGGHAFLMSATLGDAARNDLKKASGFASTPASPEEAAAAPFPRLELHAGAAHMEASLPVPPSSGKDVSFSLVSSEDNERVLRDAIDAAEGGAKVVVLRNTVKDCLETQEFVEFHASPKLLLRSKGVPAPHHSRFCPEDRKCLDRALLARIGKERTDGGALIVATQTIQQSLDIDADFLVTDLCPMDVLLQRVGRLHRHRRDARPGGFERARCAVLSLSTKELLERIQNKGKAFGSQGLGSVYMDLRILELTRRTLEAASEVRIPRDNRPLVEASLHPAHLVSLETEDPKWRAHGEHVRTEVHADRRAATSVLIETDEPLHWNANAWDGPAPTRLTEDDGRRVFFDPPPKSPFGNVIRELQVRERWLRGLEAMEELRAIPCPTPGGFTFRVGPHDFVYDRLGLRPASHQ